MFGVAYAQSPGAAPGGMDLISMLPLLLMFVLLYFLLMRPQMKRAKEHRQLLAGLQKGDEVITSGGTLGKVTNVSEQYVKIEIATGVEIVVQKPSVQSVLPKGTIKSAA